MDENITTDSVPKKENFFLKRIRAYPVLTFTLVTLFLLRFIVMIILYFTEYDTTVEQYGFSIGFFLIAIPFIYFLQWLIATWVATKFTVETLKLKFQRHPIATILFALAYIIDLPYRLAESDLGGGLMMMFNIFEVVVYYAFMSFLWWLLICWISKKIWKTQKFAWVRYKKLIDNIFVILPPLYKFILGLMVALLIFFVLFIVFAGILGYSGADLRTL